MAIPELGPATPYPSNIEFAQFSSLAVVFGKGDTIKDVNVQLTGFTHTHPDDIDILLVGPTGAKAVVMSDVGGSNAVSNLTLTLDDQAPSALPDTASARTGRFRPTNIGTGDTFAAPAPTAVGWSALAVFNGTKPQGTWRLYVVDDESGNAGQIATGWTLQLKTGPPQRAAQCRVPRVIGMRLAAARTRLRRANCRSGRIRYARSRVRRGRVISQSPRAGVRRSRGARVNLVLSRGLA